MQILYRGQGQNQSQKVTVNPSPGGSLVPPSSQVRKVHFDTQDYGPQSITGLEPKHVPLLHQPQRKGSLEWENACHVSGRGPTAGCGRGRGAPTSFSFLCTDALRKLTKLGLRAPRNTGVSKGLDISKEAAEESLHGDPRI